MPLSQKTFAVTRKEGGDWERFVEHKRAPDHEGLKVHSIMFDDGSVWDACNGWRPEPTRPTPDDLRKAWATGSTKVD